MADYNQNLAESEHYKRMERLQGARDELTSVINHFYDYPPKSEGENVEYVMDMKDRVGGVIDRLESFLRSL